MSDVLLRFERDRKYSYADYRQWPDDERWELIDGVPYAMTPTPSRQHQRILLEIARQISNHLLDKACEVYPAPFDVRLFAEDRKDEDVENVVQPDITVVCDPTKLDDQGCAGAPDLIVEILSPGTGKHDRWRKYKLYERAGVGEYWIVDPVMKTVEVFLLENGKYALRGVYGNEDMVKVSFLPDLAIDLRLVFRDEKHGE
ncbi:Uma2 family endonuclease [Bacillaceae bacterium]